MTSDLSRATLAALLFPALVLALPRPALAAYTAPGLEIDGDYVDDPGPREDWYPGFPPMRDPIGSADESLCGTSPAPKNDIYQYFIANNFDHLFVGMERLTNNGNTSFFFSFDITGDGPSFGDFIFVFCFGSGEVVTDTYVLEYDPATGEFVVDGTPPSVLFEVNTTRTFAPFGTVDEHGRVSNSIDPGRFAEARITLADIEGFDVCDADDVTAEIQTKSSCSLSSECKDTTGPFRFSFEPLTVDLVLSQPPSCDPAIVATANADTPRSSVAYRWFLNGTDITDRDPSYATSDTIEIRLDAECGPNEVRVIVDDGACTAEDAATHDVNRRPLARIDALAVGSCDMTLTYDGGSSSDCSGAALGFAWDFDGDGLIDSTSPSGTHVFPRCGPATVTLVVTDGECVSEPVSRDVYVNEPPVAALTAFRGECLEISWAASSTDCDLLQPGSGESLTQLLDFGDGSQATTAASGTHEYAACGTYLLTLTTTDAAGCTSTDTREVTFTGVLTVE